MLPIDIAPFYKLNNAEYLGFMTDARKLITTATIEKLMLTTAVLALYDSGLERLTDHIIKPRGNEETPQMSEAESERDGYVRYIASGVRRAAALSAASTVKEAGEKLLPLFKGHSDIASLPNKQESELIDALLYDFDKPEYEPHVTALGLDEVTAKLRAANTRYKELSVARTEARAAALETGKIIRSDMKDQYDKVWLIASTATILAPSPEVDEFIAGLNKLIGETKTLYKMRFAQRKTQATGKTA